MAQGTLTSAPTTLNFGGLRMSAEEFFQLLDGGHDYELLDGVVMMTPRPAPLHQKVALEIVWQINTFIRDKRFGQVFHETDVHLGQGPEGGDLVYRPEIVYYRSERLSGMADRLVGPPDVAVEVISPPSRLYDTQTKRDDYERCGVAEYWIVDPEKNEFTFLRNVNGKLESVVSTADHYTSQAIPGFTLDLAEVRKRFQW